MAPPGHSTAVCLSHQDQIGGSVILVSTWCLVTVTPYQPIPRPDLRRRPGDFIKASRTDFCFQWIVRQWKQMLLLLLVLHIWRPNWHANLKPISNVLVGRNAVRKKWQKQNYDTKTCFTNLSKFIWWEMNRSELVQRNNHRKFFATGVCCSRAQRSGNILHCHHLTFRFPQLCSGIEYDDVEGLMLARWDAC
jgi:hypothetical protein